MTEDRKEEKRSGGIKELASKLEAELQELHGQIRDLAMGSIYVLKPVTCDGEESLAGTASVSDSASAHADFLKDCLAEVREMQAIVTSTLQRLDL